VTTPEGQAGAPDAAAGLRIREAVRAVLLTPGHEVLLVRFDFPNTGLRWAMPGGGLEPGETHLDALHRELAEEVGLADPPAGVHVWDRLHVIPFIDGRWDGQRERFFLVSTERFEPAPHLTWPELNAEYVFELRWWHVDEITDGLPFVPADMAGHLRRLIRHGPPNSPVQVGI